MGTPYQRWYQEVDQAVLAKMGMHYDELPNYTDLGSLYAEDVSVPDAVRAVLLDQGWNTP